MHTKILTENCVPKKLLNIGIHKYYKKNDVIIHDTKLMEDMYILISGELINILDSPDGQMHCGFLILPPKTFGGTINNNCLKCPGSVKSRKNSEIIIINKNSLKKIIESDIEIAEYNSRINTDYINLLHRLIFYYIQLSNLQKIKSIIIEFAEYFGEKKNNKIKINYRMSHQLISSLAGIKIRTTDNIFKKLKEDNFLEYHQGYYYIQDLTLLEQITSTEFMLSEKATSLKYSI